ncbi:MAG: NUDIX hydrolase [Comamonadaceae bacterium]|nr:MAG: NUDIX hydrolase [Comamonadaceae bacterium]
MELNHEAVAGVPHPAATIIMLRDGTDGLEVYLMKRHAQSSAFGGAYVFPGGKVDAPDADANITGRLDQSLAALHPSLNEPELDEPTVAGLYVAAIREVFEECGVLFAHGAGPALVAKAAERLRSGETFNAMAAQLDLRFLTSRLAPWSRWITPLMPSMSKKRFDTRFFVAAVPAGQTALHDNHEAIDSAWLGPRAALDRYRDGEVELAAPQIMTLAHLSRFADVDAAMQHARSRKPALIQPEPFELEGKRMVCYPGDDCHPVRERAMPGPTRLHLSGKRFVPIDGHESLFS